MSVRIAVLALLLAGQMTTGQRLTVESPHHRVVAGAWADAAAFNRKVKVLFLSVGTAEPARMLTGIKGLHESLEKAGIQHVYYESPGTAHKWQTWRRSLRQFAGLIFK